MLKVLEGAIRREMALEDFCAKQTSEIVQLNRLVGFFQVLPIPNNILLVLDKVLVLRTFSY